MGSGKKWGRGEEEKKILVHRTMKKCKRNGRVLQVRFSAPTQGEKAD
jgi:hypothetical protein